MKRDHVLFTCLCVILGACSSPSDEAKPVAARAEVERPRDPWVIRSVLDEQSRMITIALHDELWVAYDAMHGGLYKAWKGGVNFDGPVYTTRHGVQPTSLGNMVYLDGKLEQTNWRIIENDEVIAPHVQFKGYRFSDSRVNLKYELNLRSGESVLVEESPEYVSNQNKQPGLERVFTVAQLPTNTMLALVLKSAAENYKTDGKIENDLLILNSNSSTELTIHFDPEKIVPRELQVAEAVPAGLQLIQDNGCVSCHQIKQATVGPSYLDVARRYEATEANISMLANKIIKGGSGTWGKVLMNPHPKLKLDDARTMVAYVLSLAAEEDESEQKDEGPDYFLGMPSFTLALDAETGKEKNQQLRAGLATNVFLLEDQHFVPAEFPDKYTPVLSGIAPAVQLTRSVDFGEFQNNVFFEFRGFINVAEAGNYTFRMPSKSGSHLYINGKQVIYNGGFRGWRSRDGRVTLKKGANSFTLLFYSQHDVISDGGISLQWATDDGEKFVVVPAEVFTHTTSLLRDVVPYIEKEGRARNIPGDKSPVAGVHPSFDLSQARPDDFDGKIGGMDFLSDGRLVVSTWDAAGAVYILSGIEKNDPAKMSAKRVASGLAEPLGLKVVDDEIYVLQKQELTRLVDHDGDEITDEYQTVSDKWGVSANFHEFSYGLVYEDGYFYANLAIAIASGGASVASQHPDRGTVARIAREDGQVEIVARGLRQPNGIGVGVDGELFISDNQGDWLPSSKILHVQKDAWYGSRAVDYEGTAGLTATPPVVWLPQDEIGNSPGNPIYFNVGPYKDQMIHTEVTHGGLKRVFVEKINGQYQGAVFRFTQGMEAGINRVIRGPDGAFYAGGIGSISNWGQGDVGKKLFGLQKLKYNGKPTFEMLAVRAKSNGLELEFTLPLGERDGTSVDDYQLQQWYYLPTENYGGPKMGLENLKIQSVHISRDRKKVFLEAEGMKERHVVYVRIVNPFVSPGDYSLWSTEAWYTLNTIPSDDRGFVQPAKPVPTNSLTEREKNEGWQSLFDGKTMEHWRGYNKDHISIAWQIDQESMSLDTSQKVEGGFKGHGAYSIITKEKYQDFELNLEWKVEKGGNSGIMYNSVEGEQYKYAFETGMEMQVLDNFHHVDSVLKHRAGDLYDLISCKFVTANPHETWNRVRIISKDGHVQHWLNGYKVVEYEMQTAQFWEMVANSKWKKYPDYGKTKNGHIALQAHSDRVWYRNIRLKKL